MDFREIQYLISIAKNRNLTKAANELFVTQPTLTKFLQKIESELGVKLFKRLDNCYIPTYAGERYIAHATDMLLRKKSFDQEMSDIVNNMIGRLDIAFPIVKGTYMLPVILSSFQKLYPNVVVKLHEGATSVLEDYLLDGTADLAFFNKPSKPHDTIHYQLLVQEEMLLAVPHNHDATKIAVYLKDCKYPWIDIRKLSQEWFLLQVPEQNTRHISDKILAEAGLTPKIRLESRNVWATVGLITAGYGIGFLSETHLCLLSRNQRPFCMSVGAPKVTMEFVAAYRKSTYLSSAAKDFIKVVSQSLQGFLSGEISSSI